MINKIVRVKGVSLHVKKFAEHSVAHKREIKQGNGSCGYKVSAVIRLGFGWKLSEVNEVLLPDDERLWSYVDKCRTVRIDQLMHTEYKGGQA